MEQAQKTLLHHFSNLLTGDQSLRLEAESALKVISEKKGYGIVLTTILSKTDIPDPLRQFAAVMLRQYVVKHWDPTAEGFSLPEVQKSDKAEIRKMLPSLLASPDSKIRTAVSTVISAIGAVDFPEEWPELLPGLVQMVACDNQLVQEGALRCLVVLSEDIDDVQLTKIIPVLFPLLLKTVVNEKTNIHTRSLCFMIYRKCASGLLTLGGVEDPEELAKLLSATLPQWFEIWTKILAHIPDPSSTESSEARTALFTLRLETLKCVYQFVEFFPSLILTSLPTVLKLIWTNLVGSLPIFIRDIVEGKQAEFEYTDLEGEAMGLSAMIIETFEIFNCLAESEKQSPLLLPMMGPITQILLSYMLITNEEHAKYQEDASAYMAFEDDHTSYSVRIAAYQLLTKLLSTFEKEATVGTCVGVKNALEESEKLRSSSNAHWWKRREVGVWGFGLVAEDLQKIKTPLDANGVITKVVLPDLDNKQTNPLLKARAIWCVSHLTPLLIESKQNGMVNAALQGMVKGLGTDQSIAVRLASTRTLGILSASLKKDEMSPVLAQTLPLVCELLTHVKDDSLHTTLETLAIAVSVNPEISRKIEEHLTPLLLKQWEHCTGDPSVTEGIIEILEELMKDEKTLPQVHNRCLPVILAILGNAKRHYSGDVEAAIDLLRHLIQACHRAKQPVHGLVINTAIPTIIGLILSSEDSSVMQSGISCIAATVRAVPTQIGEAEYNKKPLVVLLCIMIVKLLTSTIEDQSTPRVGELITALLLNLPSKLGTEAVSQLVQAVVVRLHSAEFPPLQESLLMVFARLIHTHGLSTLDLLASLGTLDLKTKEKSIKPSTKDSLYPVIEYKLVDSKVHAFTSVLKKWVQAHTLDTHSPYPTKILLTALSKLLTLSNDKAVLLEKIPVDGYPIVSDKKTGKGKKYKTRAKTKSEPLKYTQIPLPAKIVSLLLQQWARESGRSEEEDDGKKSKTKQKGDKFMDEDDDGGGRGGTKKSSVFADAEDYEDIINGTSGRLVSKLGGKKEGKLTDGFMNLSDMINEGGDDDDEEGGQNAEGEDYPESLDDPLNKISLKEFIEEMFKAFRTKDGERLKKYATALNQADQALLQEIVKK